MAGFMTPLRHSGRQTNSNNEHTGHQKRFGKGVYVVCRWRDFARAELKSFPSMKTTPTAGHAFAFLCAAPPG